MTPRQPWLFYLKGLSEIAEINVPELFGSIGVFAENIEEVAQRLPEARLLVTTEPAAFDLLQTAGALGVLIAPYSAAFDADPFFADDRFALIVTSDLATVTASQINEAASALTTYWENRPS